MRLRVLSDQQPRHFFGRARGQRVSFDRTDDRALHQEMERTSEALRILQPRVCGGLASDATDVAEMADAGPAKRVTGPHLEKDVDQRTRFELLFAEPLLDVEDR